MFAFYHSILFLQGMLAVELIILAWPAKLGQSQYEED